MTKYGSSEHNQTLCITLNKQWSLYNKLYNGVSDKATSKQAALYYYNIHEDEKKKLIQWTQKRRKSYIHYQNIHFIMNIAFMVVYPT